MFHRKFVTYAVFLIALFFCSGSFAETATKNGLFPEEIISAETLLEKINNKDSLLLLDARSKKSFNESHIVGARLPLTEEYYRQEDMFREGIMKNAPDRVLALKEAMADIPNDMPIVTYCNTGCHASSVLALQLKQLGFTQAKAYDEGYQAWEQKGYPVTSSKTAK